ncbi:transposase [Amaricoccus sp.]|uniref:transposase n=1 Tax=Amaricoccus sp. TaxID=1872485 RepID=UPI001B59972D|nr:transposase [Amaricoccus sp.]MBP7243087.1 transposase [Amaricoccus sp.]
MTGASANIQTDMTAGDSDTAPGVLAQSVGGFGGIGPTSKSWFGVGGDGGDGAAVSVASSGSTVTTFGYSSAGLAGQSIGGGGGSAGVSAARSLVYASGCVHLREETPPHGESDGGGGGARPVHWRLLTTRDVGTVAGALDVAERSAKRWKIEELFRTMKRKGFDVERLRIGEEAPRSRLILACLLAATVIMQMTAERDGGSDGRALRPLTDAFDPEDRPLLEAISRNLEGRTERQKNPHPKGSLAFATWICARLGGWTGYYGKPGPSVILSGWTEFQSIKQGAYLAPLIANANPNDG